MSYYKRCNNKLDARTEDYVFSVKSKDDADLLALKEDVRVFNASIRERVRDVASTCGTERALEYMKHTPLHRIRLMARGPRVRWSLKDFGNRRAYDQSLPHKYAAYFDVYRGQDTHNQYKLREQISLDITPSQQALINKFYDEEVELMLNQAKRAREAGLVQKFDTKRRKSFYAGENYVE